MTAAVRTTTAFQASRLERVFAGCFAADLRTRLVGGADEPYYEPAAAAGDWHCIYYRDDFFASALHEVAHWCIAGPERRQQPDFGYWYAPDGRDPAQQRAFEAVESKPQALEWLFSRACGYRFRLSADNLADDGQLAPQETFARAVVSQARRMAAAGLPARAARFYDALRSEFGTPLAASGQQFALSQLD